MDLKVLQKVVLSCLDYYSPGKSRTKQLPIACLFADNDSCGCLSSVKETVPTA